MSDYLLTIRVPFSAMDDPAAREAANKLLEDAQLLTESTTSSVKLQRLQHKKPPVAVALKLD